jgi:hypothetical protein
MQIAVKMSSGWLVAEVPLDHRQRDTGLDESQGVGGPQVVGSGRVVRPLSLVLVLVKTGNADVGVEVLGSHSMVGPLRASPLPELVNTHSPGQIMVGQGVRRHVDRADAVLGLRWLQLETLTVK